MIATTLGQQGFELLEDGLDEVRWECGHGFSPSSGSLEDSPDDRASRVRFPSSGPSHLSAQALIYRVGWGWPLLTKGACSKSGPKHRRRSFRLGLVLLFIPRPLTRAYRHIHPSDVSFGRRCP